MPKKGKKFINKARSRAMRKMWAKKRAAIQSKELEKHGVATDTEVRKKLDELKVKTLSARDYTREYPLTPSELTSAYQNAEVTRLNERIRVLEARVKEQSHKIQHLQTLANAIHSITNTMTNV